MTWSLCMIVKNEEKVLARCLSSTLDLFDEIVIVDTGSTDKTVEIAHQYTDHVYVIPWDNDFSKARNYAFDKATKDYVMWLDADDVILKHDYDDLKKWKQEMNQDIDIVMLLYNIAFDSEGNPTFSYYRERLLKREKQYRFHDRVHEYIPLVGNIVKKKIAITHQKENRESSDRNLKIYQLMEKNGETFTPRNYYYYGRELRDHGMDSEAIEKLEHFLAVNKGWLEDNINACLLLSEVYLTLGDHKKASEILYRSFVYDLPREKTCCKIGDLFFLDQKYTEAIFWYSLATTLPHRDIVGFEEKDYRDFIPYLQLCRCYYGNHDLEKSYFYHLKAKECKAKHPTVLYNDQFFEIQRKVQE